MLSSERAACEGECEGTLTPITTFVVEFYGSTQDRLRRATGPAKNLFFSNQELYYLFHLTKLQTSGCCIYSSVWHLVVPICVTDFFSVGGLQKSELIGTDLLNYMIC